MDRAAEHPFKTIWFILLVTLWMVIWGILRVREALANTTVWQSAGMTVPSQYFMLTGAAFALLGIASLLITLIRPKLGSHLSLGAMMLWLLWYWADFILVRSNALAKEGWPYLLVVTALTLAFALIQVTRLRRSIRENL